MKVKRSTIEYFASTWSSGLATLAFQSGELVHCDSGRTGRSLGNAFDAFASGHCIDSDILNGKEIVWWMDDFGLVLGGFVPYWEWESNGLPPLDPGVPYEFDVESGEVAHLEEEF